MYFRSRQQDNKDSASQQGHEKWQGTTSQWEHQQKHGKLLWGGFFFSNFFILYLIFVLADTPTNPQPTQRVKTVMAAAVAAWDATPLKLLVCFIILLLH